MSRIASTYRRDKLADDPNILHEIHRVNSSCIETPWKSVYIAGAVCFVIAAQMSLYFSSVWPYMQILDPQVTENFFGLIIASYSMGQIVGSPLVGYWSNKTKNIRHPLTVCLVMSIIGNCIYISAPLISHSRKYAILLSRVTVGAGASAIGLLRTFAATASTKEDRTKSIAFVTGGFALGMSSGPAMQLAFVPLGYPGITLVHRLTLSMYSMPAWTGLAASIMGILLIQLVFEEKYAGLVSKVEVQENGEIKTVKLPPYDRLAAFICYCTRFAQMFTYTNLEASSQFLALNFITIDSQINTIGAPLVMASYAFSKADTVTYMAISHSLMSGLAFCVYTSFVLFKLDKYMKFRFHVMASISGLILFHVVTFAYPFWPTITETYTDFDLHNSTNKTEPVGCNISRLKWCPDMTPTNVWVYFASFSIFIGLCFPNINLSVGTLFSHIIGPRRQATQQGVMLMSGSLARLSGPILISALYTEYGPRWAWILEIVVLVLTVLLWAIFYKRMVPLEIDENERPPLPSEFPPPLSSSSTDEADKVARIRF